MPFSLVASASRLILARRHSTLKLEQLASEGSVLKSLLDIKDYRLQFAGHETFTLRYGWLKKAFDALIRIEKLGSSDPAAIFTDVKSIADFGVGKNMVQSMRHWALATSVIQEDTYLPTRFGRAIFSDDGDPYLEQPGSLWLLHWHLASLPGRATTWHWAFNEFNEPTFDRDLLLSRIMARIELLRESGRMKEYRVTEATVRRDVECFVRTYLVKSATSKGLHEENLESPLSELALIQPMGVGGGFQFRRGPKSTLPNEVFLYGLLRFWNELYKTRREFSVESLTHEPGSPGRVFLLDEESVAERLASMPDLTDGAIQWDESTGLRQVYADDPSSIDPLEYIRGLFKTALHARVA
jgi:hypothetical protein